MSLAWTINSLENQLSELPKPGEHRKRLVERMAAALRYGHGADAVGTAGCAARVTLHGIKAHGIGVDGAVRAWIIAARRQMEEPG